ncbi:hypothetical protein GQ457_01G032130 [Hibiscus cannabinus]
MVEPSFLGWNRGTWGGLMGCKRWSVHSIMVVPSDHGVLMIHRVGKFDKMLICRPWTHDTISTRWCKPNLGSKAKSWGCNESITLLGYYGYLWDRGCGVFRPCSGKLRSECSRAYSATLWLSYVMTHDLEPLDTPLGCGQILVATDLGCGISHVSRLPIETLEPPLAYHNYKIDQDCPMVEIFLPPMSDKRVKDRPGNSSRGCNLDFSRNRTCGSDCHCLWETDDPSKELAKQIEGLHFTEEELKGVDEIGELNKEPIEGEEKWVVGKLVSPRIVDGPQLIRVYFSVWKKHPLEEATSLGPNMFLFKFKKEEDKDFVLGRCPWTFDGELLALKSFDRLLTPKEYDFHPLPIWVRIYDVSLGYMNNKAGEAIGNNFGKHIVTDLRDDMGCAGQYLRLRIDIDCSKPLRRCTVLGRNFKSGQPRVCMAKYERLPRFCFYCGIIGHEYQLCLDKPNGVFPPFQFGDWLRVESTNDIDGNRKKSRPVIVFAQKGELDVGGKVLKDKAHDVIEGKSSKIVVDHDSGLKGEDSGMKGEATKKNEKSPNVTTDELGHLAIPKAKPKNAKHSYKERGEGNSLKNPTLMKHYRPISLCNVVYKTCSKVLANRLKDLMPLCIVEDQSAFVKGRLISDNVIVANELFHYLKGSKNGPNKGATVKLDMEKAYNRVEWHFLYDIMGKMGFAPKWIDAVMNCVYFVSYCFKINDVISEAFRPSRGLRQGDPLPPTFSSFAHRGSRLCCSRNKGKGELEVLKQVRMDQEPIIFSSSGQKVNTEKSSIYFSNGMSEQSKDEIKLILSMRDDEVLGQYLGLPLIVGKSKIEAFGFLETKVEKRTNNWTKNLLSFAGREVFIKAVAQSIPTYTMSCFLLPDCIIDPMVSTARNFWWSGKTNEKGWTHVAWQNLCKPKGARRLGFRDLKTFNLALLAKQVWRLICNNESLCFKVMSAKYFPRGDILQANRGKKHPLSGVVFSGLNRQSKGDFIGDSGLIAESEFSKMSGEVCPPFSGPPCLNLAAFATDNFPCLCP